MIETILRETEADAYEIYLSDSTSNNFRKRYNPAYKDNRKQPKPKHYEALKYYLVSEEGAWITAEQEADDLLGIQQDKVKFDTVVVSIDKDLFQIPGNHYNFVKKEKTFVTQEQGLYHFYAQLLIGDVSDNIFGVYGIGPVKTRSAFADCRSSEDYFRVVSDLYENNYPRLLINGVCLKIRTIPDEIWSFPPSFQNVEPSMDELLCYLQTKPEEISQSSGPTTREPSGSQQLGQTKEKSSSQQMENPSTQD